MRLPAEAVQRLRPFFDGRRVCVTGGCGFIGGHLVDALLSLGATTAVLDDLSNSDAEHVCELIDFEPTRVRFLRGSILDDRALAEAVDGASVVFHLGAIGSVPRSIDDPHRAWAVNATGTVRVLEAARRAGVERVVNSSSSSVYGNAPELPKHEGMVPRPASPYAASKLAGEGACRAWAEAYGLSGVSLRYFNVFGPRQSADSAYAAVIPAFATRLIAGRPPVIHGEGSQTRDLTPVANAVYANLLGASREGITPGVAVNVGVGERTSVLELARLLAERLDASGIDPEFDAPRAGDVADSLASLELARDELGYGPIVSLADGLAEAAAWYAGQVAGQADRP